MNDYDVTIDRDIYIGGSDIGCIMGISPFKTRYELLLEKCGLKENDFVGNRYTLYGQKIEPLIREYINHVLQTTFEPNRVINDDFRSHTDGFNGECVLEIKSTSSIYESVDEYKLYLVQLIKYMEQNNVNKGVLAVYDRPKDFDITNVEFEPKRLQIFDITADQYKDLLDEINCELDRFRTDLERLKNNPLLSEQDFQPNELVALSSKVIVFENRLAELKALEAECKQAKMALFEAMQKHDVKSWTTPNNTKITRVDGTPASVETVKEFDVDTFKSENEEMYNEYVKTVEKKKSARSGYVKITMPKM